MTIRGERPQRATLVDVALAARVSRQTVSNVLNNPDKVAPGTAAKVRAEIERLKFRPNLAARALRQQKANALGIEMNATGHRRLGSILDSFLVELTITARERDAHVITFAAADHLAPLAEYERLHATQMVSGFVLTNTRPDDPRPGWLRDHKIPFVSFGRVWDDPGFTNWVDVDGLSGVAQGVRHLVDQGYGSIGYLGWPHGSPVGDDRHAGWVAATTEFGIHDPSLAAVSPQDLGEAVEAAHSLIAQVGDGGASGGVSDTLALATYKALKDQGLRPGVDMGLMGFDDNEFAEAFGLTSLRQPLDEIAETLLTFLDLAEAGAPAPSSGVVFNTTVVPRSSTSRKSADRYSTNHSSTNHSSTNRTSTNRTSTNGSSSSHEQANNQTAGNRAHDGGN